MTPCRPSARADADGADASAYVQEIGERLFELLLTDYLADEQPGAYTVLSMLRVISSRVSLRRPTRPSYMRTHFRWARITKVVSDPQGCRSACTGGVDRTFAMIWC